MRAQHLGGRVATGHAGHPQLPRNRDHRLIHYRRNQETGACCHRLPRLVLVQHGPGTDHQAVALREFPDQFENTRYGQGELDHPEATADGRFHGQCGPVLIVRTKDGAGLLPA